MMPLDDADSSASPGQRHYTFNFATIRQDIDDPVNATILRRSFASMTSLQAFYPSQSHSDVDGLPSDFVPLEILLDDRSESTDFARIVPQTDCQIQYDKFNQLRLRNRMQTEMTASKSPFNEHLRSKMVSSRNASLVCCHLHMLIPLSRTPFLSNLLSLLGRSREFQDLVRVHVPRFTVTATNAQFSSLYNGKLARTG